jgi:hypothetical protein
MCTLLCPFCLPVLSLLCLWLFRRLFFRRLHWLPCLIYSMTPFINQGTDDANTAVVDDVRLIL